MELHLRLKVQEGAAFMKGTALFMQEGGMVGPDVHDGMPFMGFAREARTATDERLVWVVSTATDEQAALLKVQSDHWDAMPAPHPW